MGALRISRRVAVLLTLALSAPAFAQSEPAALTRSVWSAYESALEFREGGNLEVAVRQLKALLAEHPDYLPGRILLGETYLDLGFPAAAEVQLREAQRSGAGPSRVAVVIARSLYEQRRYRDLLDEMHPPGHPRPVQVQLLALRAMARLALNDLDGAESVLDDARVLAPESAELMVARTHLALRRGAPAQAVVAATEATERAPTSADAWYVRGIAHLANGDAAGALHHLDRALELAPRYMPARTARASVLLDMGRVEEARGDVELVRGITSDDAQAAYLHARILRHDGDLARARIALEEATAALDQIPGEIILADPSLLLLAGQVALARDNRELAFNRFQSFVSRYPDTPAGRPQLARLLLMRGDFQAAHDILEPMVREAVENADLLELWGTILLGLERFGAAIETLQPLLTRRPEHVALRLKLARAYLSSGAEAAGLEQLYAVLDIVPGQRMAALTAGMRKLASGDAAEAARLANLVLAQAADDVEARNLLGAAQAAAGRPEAALETFREGLRRAPGHVAIATNLAELQLRRGDRSAAIQTYLDALQANENAVPLMMAVAAAYEGAQHGQEALRWLARARATPGAGLGPALALVDLHLRQADVEGARNVVRELEVAQRDNLAVMAASARVDLAAGEQVAARVTLEAMSRLAGYDSQALLAIADLQARGNDLSGAVWSLQKAVSGDPGDRRARVALTELLIRQGNAALARDQVEMLHELLAGAAVTARLEGDLLLLEGRPGDAVDAYTRALSRNEADSDLVVRRFRARRRNGEPATALEELRTHLAAQPADQLVRMTLANALRADGDTDGARTAYEALLAIDPDDTLALNNLASLLRVSEPERALELASRAYRRAPEAAPVLDTLGWILVSRGDHARGLSLLRGAEARAGVRADIRYHQAVALEGLGRRDAALQALREALALQAPFAERAEAEALLARLQAGEG